MIALINQHAKTGLRGDKHFIRAIGQFESQTASCAGIRKFRRVCSVRLSVKRGGGKRCGDRAFRERQINVFPDSRVTDVFKIPGRRLAEIDR